MAFPYETIEKEHITCNFCGGDNYKVLSRQGTDGLALISVICKKCGLIYINPRMTRQGYKLYYEDEYRTKTIINGEKGSDFDCTKLYDTTQGHGKALADLMTPFLKAEGPIMEVGSGVGGVLAGIRDALKREVVGLEPSGKEAAYANTRGIKTYHALIEEHVGQEKYAAIVSTQSLNHFLDPRYFFSWAHASLEDGGILVVEVMNFRQQLKKAGKYKNSVKIDHVYMFTPEVLRDFVRSAGFEIAYFDADEFSKKKRSQGIPGIHIRIVGRRLPKVPFSELVISPDNFKLTLSSINKYKIYFKYLFFVRIPQLLRIS